MLRLNRQGAAQILAQIDADPATSGFGLALIHMGGARPTIVRQPVGGPTTGNWVAIEEVQRPEAREQEAGGAGERLRSIRRRLERAIRPGGGSMGRAMGREIAGIRIDMPSPNLSLVSSDRLQTLMTAGVSMGLSCGGMALSGVALVGEAAGGVTSVFLIFTWAAFTASTVQCGLDTARFAAEFSEPGTIRRMDRDPSYRTVRRTIDTTAAVTSVSSIPASTRTFARQARGAVRRVRMGAPVRVAAPPPSILRTPPPSWLTGARGHFTRITVVQQALAAAVSAGISTSTSADARGVVIHLINPS